MLMGFFGEALLGTLEIGFGQSVGLAAGLLLKRQRRFKTDKIKRIDSYLCPVLLGKVFFL